MSNCKDCGARKDHYMAPDGCPFCYPEHEVFHKYTLTTLPDGRIDGTYETNDDEDRGYPSAHAVGVVGYRDYAQMKAHTGLSHTGANGCKVTVILDGEEV